MAAYEFAVTGKIEVDEDAVGVASIRSTTLRPL
jgi:hypothetical protein